MEIILNRSEFLALTALTQAQNIIGLDAEQLLPPTLEARQAMYDEGEASLRQRDLLRVEAGGVAVLEETLLRNILVVAHPDNALVVIKTVPHVGQQLFLYYGKANLFIEQTLPTPHQHRLADIGPEDELIARLQAVFPLTSAVAGTSDDSLPLTVPQQTAIDVFQRATRGAVVEARALLTSTLTTNSLLADALVADFANSIFSGTIAIYRGTDNSDVDTREIALVQGPSSGWLILPDADDLTAVQLVRANTNGLANYLATLL